jgi:hypothetical protein
MRIKITQETIFGTVTKFFDDRTEAMEWVRISLANRVPCQIEFSR